MPRQSAHPAAEVQPHFAEKIWADLMEGNKRFMAGKPRARDLVALRRSLVNDQHPKAVVLTCSDSFEFSPTMRSKYPVAINVWK